MHSADGGSRSVDGAMHRQAPTGTPDRMRPASHEVAHAPAPVLLVGDTHSQQSALVYELRSTSYRITMAASGHEALQLLGDFDFALTLLDVDMPSMDGIETAAKIRELAVATGRDLPVLFVTTSEHDCGRILQSYVGGSVDLLPFPWEPSLLRFKVAVLVESYRSRELLRLRLEAASRAREEQLAMVSHDLRNPLTAVILGAKRIEKLAGSSADGARTKKAVATIFRAGAAMNQLIGDLLDLTTLNAGQALSIELETVDLRALVEDAVDIIEPLATARRIVISVNGHGASVRCDPRRIAQVLANLLGNASKFTREEGSITIRTEPRESDVMVSVSDTGIGIAEGDLAKIFSPYWKADHDAVRGVGLGLAIVKGIVDAHGGRVWVHSVVDVGSTFHFTLPAAPSEETT